MIFRRDEPSRLPLHLSARRCRERNDERYSTIKGEESGVRPTRDKSNSRRYGVVRPEKKVREKSSDNREFPVNDKIEIRDSFSAEVKLATTSGVPVN